MTGRQHPPQGKRCRRHQSRCRVTGVRRFLIDRSTLLKGKNKIKKCPALTISDKMGVGGKTLLFFYPKKLLLCPFLQ